MKTLFTIALAASLGLSSIANAANENITSLSNVEAKEKKVQVALKEGLGKVKLAILDENGKALHSQHIKVKKDTNVPYDLSNLPSGSYYVTIESEDDKAIYPIETKDSPVALPLMAYGKSIEDNSIRLAVIGLEEPGVEVKIMDSKGKTMFKETIDQPEGFTKIYRLESVSPEDVSVKVTDAKGRSKTLYF